VGDKRVAIDQSRACGQSITLGFVLAAFVLTLSSAICGAEEVAAAAPRPFAGSQAPPFTGETLDGDALALEQLRGSLVLLNFWATWCEPCVTEMADFQSYIEQSKQTERDIDLTIIAVNVGEKPETVRRFLAEHAPDVSVVLDPNRSIVSQYWLYGMPATFLIDEDGIILLRIMGPVTVETVLNMLLRVQGYSSEVDTGIYHGQRTVLRGTEWQCSESPFDRHMIVPIAPSVDIFARQQARHGLEITAKMRLVIVTT